jgi:hypothetical protein
MDENNFNSINIINHCIENFVIRYDIYQPNYFDNYIDLLEIGNNNFKLDRSKLKFIENDYDMITYGIVYNSNNFKIINEFSYRMSDMYYSIKNLMDIPVYLKIYIRGIFINKILLEKKETQWLLNGGFPFLLYLLNYRDFVFKFYSDPLSLEELNNVDFILYGSEFNNNNDRKQFMLDLKKGLACKYDDYIYLFYLCEYKIFSYFPITYIEQKIGYKLYIPKNSFIEYQKECKYRIINRTKLIEEELIKKTWKPDRFIKYCLDIEEQKELDIF